MTSGDAFSMDTRPHPTHVDTAEVPMAPIVPGSSLSLLRPVYRLRWRKSVFKKIALSQHLRVIAGHGSSQTVPD